MKNLILLLSAVGATACGAKTSSISDYADGSFRGSTLAARSGDANTAECPYGGNLLSFGIDKNGNGSLDAGEVAGVFPVCDGAPGSAAIDGNVAAGGSVFVDSRGSVVPLISGNSGSAGADINSMGYIVDANGYLWSYYNNSYNLSQATSLSSIFTFTVRGHDVETGFTTNNCSGTAYILVDVVTASRRLAAHSVSSGKWYYLPDPNSLALLQIASTLSGSNGCSTTGVTDPNNPNNLIPGSRAGLGARVDALIEADLPAMPGTPPYHIEFVP